MVADGRPGRLASSLEVRVPLMHPGPGEIAGVWVKGDGDVVEGGVAPLIKDLDAIPFPDYGVDDAYVEYGGRVQPLTSDSQRLEIEKQPYDMPEGGTFGIISSRGCPYACTYCSNDYFRKLYGKQYRVRR